MRLWVYLVALAVVAGIDAAAAAILQWPFEKAVALSPVIVLVAGATVGIFVLWARMLRESVGRRPGSR
jgi:hypothetical protein